MPTTAEAGTPQFTASGWNAMFAPQGTPKEIVDRLAAAVDAALTNPATRAKLEEIGAMIPPRTAGAAQPRCERDREMDAGDPGGGRGGELAPPARSPGQIKSCF